jgi:hypothetical protein
VDEYDRLKALELEAEESSSESEDEGKKRGNILDTLTPEELKAAQKAALLRQYAYVDTDSDELAISGLSIGEGRDPNAPARAGANKGEDKEKEDRRRAIEEALRLDGKKKKHKKNKEGESFIGILLTAVDLLAPNLNKDKMLYTAQMEREAQKSTAQARKERDKAALDKQR